MDTNEPGAANARRRNHAKETEKKTQRFREDKDWEDDNDFMRQPAAVSFSMNRWQERRIHPAAARYFQRAAD